MWLGKCLLMSNFLTVLPQDVFKYSPGFYIGSGQYVWGVSRNKLLVHGGAFLQK